MGYQGPRYGTIAVPHGMVGPDQRPRRRARRCRPRRFTNWTEWCFRARFSSRLHTHCSGKGRHSSGKSQAIAPETSIRVIGSPSHRTASRAGCFLGHRVRNSHQWVISLAAHGRHSRFAVFRCNASLFRSNGLVSEAIRIHEVIEKYRCPFRSNADRDSPRLLPAAKLDGWVESEREG